MDPFSPGNPIMFLPGPMTGYPFSSSSRTCVVTGKASMPVYIKIEDEKVEICDASEFWGMRTDAFDIKFAESPDDNRFQTCYIGPAGENMVPMASILHTAARAAGRGGVGAVMGSKKLKAIAVKGTGFPEVADHKKYLELVEQTRNKFAEPNVTRRREAGTAGLLTSKSNASREAVRNYREGTFANIDKISAKTAREKVWQRDYACYSCAISCKKSGVVEKGLYAGLVHDGPEYETGVMYGPNLMIGNLEGLLKKIYAGDDYGIDIISSGNSIGFLMEALEKGYIDKDFLDGVDLTWGNVPAVLEMIKKISYREGIGELAAHNVHIDPGMGISYATSNRGACHINGGSVHQQNFTTMLDSIGLCVIAFYSYPKNGPEEILSMITGQPYTTEEYLKAGERIFNLEKMFNYREGFRREDDVLPDRFFEEPLTIGSEKLESLRLEFTMK